MQRGKIAHHLFIVLLLVGVHRLRVLTEVVQPRELLPAVASEWSFTGMFSADNIRVSDENKVGPAPHTGYAARDARCD